jgi:hypothetical protein
MRVIEKNDSTDVDKLVEKFWFELGSACLAAHVTRKSEITVEEMTKVVEALKAPGAAEAGAEAYARGMLHKFNQLVAAAEQIAKKKKAPFDVSYIGRQLSRQATAPPLQITVYPRPARIVTRKTVESYTKDGRIASMIEEQVEV